ncbi:MULTISPECIES: NTP transferase domain-containing protein [unclassified Streptomyces]|uniref:NTP transferase domain-containing protein n=1 Tax=unclassified Streptomyces TaxID=2593676 RepID=UPI001BED1BA4|nr:MULTISPECIES: NTP transferase domain-containing protein [unclassified Streptomyces]MBT2405546.1 NTP transferase domain-containing protein [Streptomyces sp. ISL-21]MBT2607775.1 NTP transferase domain-containing protein [Streptomyces sp. ISL-87]
MNLPTASVVPPVVIAAGGLGTRVGSWSPYLPKELRPVSGRPGLAHIVDEAAALGSGHAVVVHHPYYTPLIDWTRQVLAPGALARYQTLTNQPPAQPSAADCLQVDFIAQHGRYADITSVLNGAEHLRTGDFYVVFADNVDPTHDALSTLAKATPLDTPAVLAAPFNVESASDHGVIVCTGEGPVQRMVGLIEKPDREQAALLEAECGIANLRLLQGRMRVTPGLLRHLGAAAHGAAEPKFSLVLASYARSHRVDVVTSTKPLTDLGIPNSGGAVREDTARTVVPACS